jgi:hypothetical protein
MDLKQHLLRQMAFSHATFGPGERTAGVIDHIKKELVEVENHCGGGHPEEWVDVVILALDGLTRSLKFRHGITFERARHPRAVAGEACRMIEAKQGMNEIREWPDWRTVDPDSAIEHVRQPEGQG